MIKKYSGYIGFGSFLLGMVLGGIGWEKYESTLAWRTQGSVFLIVLGVALIIIGLAVINIYGGKKE
jgi:sulfite exporter TauE/SafE